MKVIFEAETFVGRQASGTAKVGRRIVENLLKLAPDLEISLLLSRRNGSVSEDPLCRSLKSVVVPQVPAPRMREALSYMRFNLRAGRQFDIVHYPRQIVYPFFWRLGGKCAVTIHDAGYLLLPKMRDDVGPLAPPPSASKHLFNWTLRHFIDKVDAVFVVSHWAKAEVVRHYGVRRERVHVVYNAPDEIFQPLPDREQIRRELASRYGIPEAFVLCIGRLQPHKNIRGVLRAWACVGKDIRRRFPLVILGRRSWRYQDIFELTQALGLSTEVSFLEDAVPEEDLVRFYNGARLFVFPSLFEGFGLPLAEALACGTPTVASNVASMPEIAGDAALLVDPRDPEAMSAAIRRALQDSDLREELSERAIRAAKKFSWEASARRVLEVYRTLL